MRVSREFFCAHILRNGAYGIVMRGVQKCTCAGASLRSKNYAPLHCIILDTATDPCCGSGGMFVQSVKFIQAHSGNRRSISVYGQESNADTWKMAKMNMAIRGIDADFGPYQADTFFNDLHANLRADFIMANPPFNLSNWGQDKLKEDVRWKYGTPPAGNANYAWIQHMIHHLAPNGKLGLVLANGALSTQSYGCGAFCNS